MNRRHQIGINFSIWSEIKMNQKCKNEHGIKQMNKLTLQWHDKTAIRLYGYIGLQWPYIVGCTYMLRQGLSGWAEKLAQKLGVNNNRSSNGLHSSACWSFFTHPRHIQDPWKTAETHPRQPQTITLIEMRLLVLWRWQCCWFHHLALLIKTEVLHRTSRWCSFVTRVFDAASNSSDATSWNNGSHLHELIWLFLD